MRRSAAETYEVEVQIRHDNTDQDVLIVLQDRQSLITFVEVRMTWADWAAVTLTNIFQKPGTAELRVSPHLGKERENTSVILSAEATAALREASKETFRLAASIHFGAEFPDLLAEGWQVFGADSWNGHQRRGDGYTVSIERWVEEA
jgi:hypothetical protein